MSRAVKIIRFTAIVTKNDQGFIARAVELPLTNAPTTRTKTQREAFKKLKEAVTQWLEWRADEGRLAEILDDAGFVGAIGSSKAEPRIYSTENISLPLPENWLRKNENGGERHASDAGG
jgi:predicted RNase H-like HicB family nuclease